MDRTYEGDATRQTGRGVRVCACGAAQGQSTRAMGIDRALYKRRNEIERLFRRLKGFRRIFSRFEKLDVMFVAYINFALIVDGLR